MLRYLKAKVDAYVRTLIRVDWKLTIYIYEFMTIYHIFWGSFLCVLENNHTLRETSSSRLKWSKQHSTMCAYCSNYAPLPIEIMIFDHRIIMLDQWRLLMYSEYDTHKSHAKTCCQSMRSNLWVFLFFCILLLFLFHSHPHSASDFTFRPLSNVSTQIYIYIVHTTFYLAFCSFTCSFVIIFWKFCIQIQIFKPTN